MSHPVLQGINGQGENIGAGIVASNIEIEQSPAPVGQIDFGSEQGVLVVDRTGQDLAPLWSPAFLLVIEFMRRRCA